MPNLFYKLDENSHCKRQNFAEILNEVHFGRKKIIVTRSGKPIVILISTRDLKEKTGK
jgi:prevent-host-death family protein